MKTIETGPPPSKPRTRASSKRKLFAAGGAGAAAVLAVCAIAISAAAMQGPGNIPELLPDSPPAMMADIPAPAAGSVYDAAGSPDAGYPDSPAPAEWDLLVVEQSDQAAFRHEAPDASETEDGGAPGDQAAGTGDQNVVSDADIEKSAVPASTGQAEEPAVPAATQPPAVRQPDNSAEMAALRKEIEALRQELADQKASGTPEVSVPPEAPEASAPAEAPADEDPPSWLLGEDAPDDSAGYPVPGWLVGVEQAAVMNNPYDGGPLSQCQLSTVPVPDAGFRTYADLGIPVSWLSQADLINFAIVIIGASEFDWGDWVTVAGSDGYGIQFFNDTTFGYYGQLDEYGRVCCPSYCLWLTDTGYIYEAVYPAG